MIFAGQKLRRHPALEQSHGADRSRPARPEDAALGRFRRLRLSERREGAGRRRPEAQAAQPTGAARWSRRSSRSRRWAISPRSRATTSSAWWTSATARRRATAPRAYAMTMRVKLANGFRFGFTGTPIDRTMQNTHRDFGPLKDGVQERYLSYYGIRRAIQDGATLEVHYIRDQVPFKVDEKPLERRLRADVRGDGAGGRGGQGLHPAPALAVEGTGPASGSHRDRAREDAHALSGAPRPERLQGPARRRRSQGLRALQGRARRQAEGARPAAGMVGRDHLRRPRTASPRSSASSTRRRSRTS